MNHEEVKSLLLDKKLVVIFRRIPVEQIGRVSEALVRGGVKLLEVTFDQQSQDPAADYARSIEQVRHAVGDALCLGAGTVLSCVRPTGADRRAGGRATVTTGVPGTERSLLRVWIRKSRAL